VFIRLPALKTALLSLLATAAFGGKTPVFKPFTATVDDAQGAVLIKQFVESGGDGTCTEGRARRLLEGLSPAMVEKGVKPYLNPKTPSIQIEDAMKLVSAYEVSALAAPLKNYYESLPAPKDPHVVTSVLKALSVTAPANLKPWVQGEVKARVSEDVLPDVGQSRISMEWLQLIFAAEDTASMKALQANAQAFVKQHKARELLDNDEGREYRALKDWVNSGDLSRVSEALGRKMVILSRPPADQLKDLLKLYAEEPEWGSLLLMWSAQRLRAIAVADPSLQPKIVEAIRVALPAYKDKRQESARLYDALRYFGGASSIAEQQAEMAALRKAKHSVFMPLSMRSLQN